jgi:hypothetical protein
VTKDDVANWLEESLVNPNPVIAVLAIGLTPIFPTIEVVPVVEIPDFARITKLPADPRSTGACDTAPLVKLGIAVRTSSVAISTAVATPRLFVKIFLLLIFLENLRIQIPPRPLNSLYMLSFNVSQLTPLSASAGVTSYWIGHFQLKTFVAIFRSP